MMTIGPVAQLFGAAAVLGLAVLAMDRLYMRDQKRRRQRSRTDEVISVYARKPADVAKNATAILGKRSGERSMQRLRRTAATVFGVNLDAGADLYPAPWWAIMIVLGGVTLVVAAVAARLLGALTWIGWPTASVMLARSLFGYYERRRKTRLYEQLPDALAMIVRAVRAGLPVTEALRSVGADGVPPTAGEFARLANDLAVGQSLQETLVSLATRTGLQEYRFFAVALALQGQTGGNLTETLENLAEVVRKRIAVKERAYALAAEARMTANVLIALPFVAGTALAIVAPSYFALLYETSQGRMMIVVGLGFLSAGIITMRTMIRRSLS